jgi:cytochrome c biogenesis protein ResB
MSHIYYLIIIVLTGLGSSVATYYAPQIITRYRQYKTRKTRPEKNLRAKIRKEVDLYLNELRND